MNYSCGTSIYVSRCRCAGPVQRTPDAVEADHRAAVLRARWSGFADQPLPVWLWEKFDPTAIRSDTTRRAA